MPDCATPHPQATAQVWQTMPRGCQEPNPSSLRAVSPTGLCFPHSTVHPRGLPLPQGVWVQCEASSESWGSIWE